MSQENVEIVRAVYERWSEGDFRAHVDLLDPHVVLVLGPDFSFDAGMHSGIEAVAAYTRALLEPWTHLTMEAEEIVGVGDSVLVGVRQSGAGRSSGVPTVLHYFTVWTFRGSKVIHLESFRERAEALEAVGLSEQNDPMTALPTVAVDDKIRILNAGVEAMNAREVNEALFTDDFEIVNVSNAVTDKTYRGASGAREWQHDFFDLLDENARFEITEIVEGGEDYLVVRNRLVGTGSASGVPFDMEWFSAWWFRDGRMARGVGYGSRRAALAAVHGDTHTDS